MRFHVLMTVPAIVALLSGGASAEGELFEVIRHEVDGGGTVQLFDGGPPVSEFISGNFPDEGILGFGVSDLTGIGAENSSIGASGLSTVGELSNPDPALRIITDLSVSYLGSGPDRPGGTGQAEWTSIIEFIMPVEQAEWGLNFTQGVDPGFTQNSMVTVENVTANQTLLSVTEPFGIIDEFLVAEIGDVIRVTSVFSASGTAAPNVSGLFNSGATLGMELVIPEPATIGLVALGASLCLLTRKRRGR